MLKNAIHIKDFPCHMQGFATDLEKGVMYFSCTDYIIKTDLEGNELKRVRVFGGHLGDICFYEGRVFGTLLGTPKPGDPWNAWTSYVVRSTHTTSARIALIGIGIPVKSNI